MSGGVGPRAKNWCFTLNNYTEQDLERLRGSLEDVVYLVCGKEVGASGTPHLQGFVSFRSRKRMTQCIRTIGQAHFSVTRFVPQSIEYCKKDGDYFEQGEAPKEKGRCDLEDFKRSVKEGITDMRELRELHTGVCARYPNFVKDYIADYKVKVCVATHPLYPWQVELNAELNLPPDDRLIKFLVDTTGNHGKSWFCRYYCDIHDNAQIILPGKKADMAYLVREDCRVFFIDAPRSKQGDFIQYDFLEELKNGYVFSSKYQSEIKRFKAPHVVVCMNEYPDMEKLSADRYSIVNL